MLGAANLAARLEATWPPARAWQQGPFTLRDGQGGGKRVSAANLSAPSFTDAHIADAHIADAEAAMRAHGQAPLFAIWQDCAANMGLDAALAARGYHVVDPVLFYASPVQNLIAPHDDSPAAYPHWPPLHICREIWAAAGIGPARLAVMDRAATPKCAILARSGDHPAGVCFVSNAGEFAVVHALEVAPNLRRQGSAQNLLAAAARWAAAVGAANLGLVVTRANAPARALYAKLGMQVLGQYHYRQLGQE